MSYIGLSIDISIDLLVYLIELLWVVINRNSVSLFKCPLHNHEKKKCIDIFSCTCFSSRGQDFSFWNVSHQIFDQSKEIDIIILINFSFDLDKDRIAIIQQIKGIYISVKSFS